MEEAQPFPGYSLLPLPGPGAQPQLSSSLTHPVLRVPRHISRHTPRHSPALDPSSPKLPGCSLSLPSLQSAQDNTKVGTRSPPTRLLFSKPVQNLKENSRTLFFQKKKTTPAGQKHLPSCLIQLYSPLSLLHQREHPATLRCGDPLGLLQREG